MKDATLNSRTTFFMVIIPRLPQDKAFGVARISHSPDAFCGIGIAACRHLYAQWCFALSLRGIDIQDPSFFYGFQTIPWNCPVLGLLLQCLSLPALFPYGKLQRISCQPDRIFACEGLC